MWVHLACAETEIAVRGYRCVNHPERCPRCNFEVSQDTGGRMYADRRTTWCCEWCRIVPVNGQQMPPVWLPFPPVFADVLNKVCLGMVRQASLSLTAPESQVLVDGIEEMTSVSCLRRPDSDSSGPGYCGVLGWHRAPRSAPEIIGFVRDAQEDSRSNNLNKSLCLTLLQAVELKIDRSMFLRSVRIADLPARSNLPRIFNAKDVVRHRRSDLPAIECTTERPKERLYGSSQ